jgi:hypothetical protein
VKGPLLDSVPIITITKRKKIEVEVSLGPNRKASQTIIGNVVKAIAKFKKV